MNKEFPPHKWLRKYVTPGRLLAFMAIAVAFTWFGPLLIPVAYHEVVFNLMILVVIGIVLLSIPNIIWQICWRIKYPPQIEYCKECNRALPIKYED
jgi:hypothetical protein